MACLLERVNLGLRVHSAQSQAHRWCRGRVTILLQDEHLPRPGREIIGREMVVEPVVDGGIEGTDQICSSEVGDQLVPHRNAEDEDMSSKAKAVVGAW